MAPRARTTRRSGQAMVELVLTLPLLLVVFLAVFEFTRLIETNTTLVRMANDSARLWSRRDGQSKTPAQIQAVINEALTQNGIDLSAISSTASTQPDPVTTGLVQHVVTISYLAQPIAPGDFLGYTIMAPGLTVGARSVYIAEN